MAAVGITVRLVVEVVMDGEVELLLVMVEDEAAGGGGGTPGAGTKVCAVG